MNFVDIGAAMGDTAILVRQSLGDLVGEVVCIEGLPDFYELLASNVEHLPRTRTVFALLSDGSDVPALIRQRRGTASALGGGSHPATTLDEVLTSLGLRADVIKIDCDGYDGPILAGARETLQTGPIVIFEWAPTCLRDTGNDLLQPFEALNRAGYTRFIWFDKFGAFSHFGIGVDEPTIRQLGAYCLETSQFELYYDVVAIPEQSPISDAAIADLVFARSHKVPLWAPR